ncbi:MAG: PadR family transcriptional regulator [Longimicrobiales bacterium]
MIEAKPQDPSRHIPMHPLEFQILLVLMEGKLHGYGIAMEIEERDTGLGRIFPTNLYRRLRDMAEKGLIAEAGDPAGSQKRIFGITGYGRTVARAEAERMEALVRSARGQRLLPSRPGEV